MTKFQPPYPFEQKETSWLLALLRENLFLADNHSDVSENL